MKNLLSLKLLLSVAGLFVLTGCAVNGASTSNVLDVKFFGSPQLSPIRDNYWILMKDFTIELENQSNGESYRLKIPRGFRTNLATIPRPVNVIFASYATYATAGLVHDYLYWVQPHCHGNGRDLADLIYLSVLKESLVSEINRTIQWGAVRAAWLAWSNNRHKRDAGESRYFPVDDRADFINPDLTLKTAMYLSSEQQEWEKSSDENVCKLLG